jgi:crotonobetainyl-CoA:carnitine CoA-transferase CaiB-like acyl-CoA transferase
LSKMAEPLLSGIKVLDLSQGIAGPYCCGILGRQGADVIKVEPPAGDWSRLMGAQRNGSSAVLFACNAGKRGICIDAGTEAGREALGRIAAQVDIIVQNFRPGVADRLGLGYAALMRRNERLLYVSISGFGATGPYVAMPATDTIMQAISGMMSLNRDASGTPRRIGIFLADISAALYAAQLVTAALYRREMDGQGRHIEVSLLEACAALQSMNIAERNFAGPDEATSSPPSAPSGIYQTRDGYLTLATLNDAMFGRLAIAIQRRDWIEDERFSTAVTRLRHATFLNGTVADILRPEPTSHWIERLKAADVLHAPIQSYDDLLRDPQVVHSGIFHLVEHDGVGALPLARLPGGETPTPRREPALGEHTTAVLSQFGFDDTEIEKLLAAKIATSR